MNINTITMNQSAAYAKVAAYKERLAQMKPSLSNAEIRAEYEMALKGFEALAKGSKLIDLDDVMTKCPLDSKARPKMAIARHDRKMVKFEWSRHTSRAQFHSDFGACREERPLETLIIRVNMGRTHTQVNPQGQMVWKVEGYALVPMIPLDVRPKTGIPENACILWEVEKWADHSLAVVPDIDPYLPKPVAGSLYAVIAEWDLTPLERAILHKRVTNTYR
jgi:hypothetical protein